MRLVKIGLILGAAAVLAACAIQPTPSAYNPPGFLMGLVHGFISLFSLAGSIFWDIRIYAFPNSGGWYDFGFVLGAAMFFGAIGHEGEKYRAAYYLAGYEEGFEAGKERNQNSN